MVRLAGILIVGAAIVAAQTLDTAILGIVTDPTGAVVAGASVTITNPATGSVRTVATTGAGNYEVRYLVPAEYAVEVRMTGFRTERRTGIVIQIGQQARIDVALHVGEVVETVEVGATAPLLQTENAVLGEVVGRERIINLPLIQRNFAQLAALTPGVAVVEQTNQRRTRVIANGSRDIWMQVSIDGITAVNNRHNFVVFYPPIEAIQEFKVQSGNYSAEYGGNAGASITVQLQSGTNRLHGNLFEFLRNNDLDARGYFRPRPFAKDVLRRNQFGAVFSGPLVRDKTFFMVGYEGIREKKEVAGTAIVIPPEQRRGDFSAVSGAIIDPLGGSPFQGNSIPASRLNGVSVGIINSYMPAPNVPGPINYAGVALNDANANQGLARIDHRFSDHDQVFFHYIYSGRRFPTIPLNPTFVTDNTFPNTSVAFQHVHTFSPTFLNEFRFGLQKGFIQTFNPRQNSDFRVESLGIQGLKIGGPDGREFRAGERGIPTIGIEGFLGMGDGGAGYDDSRTYQWVDNVSVIRGAHALKMGADVRYVLDDSTSVNWPWGNMAFTRDISGNSAAAYLLGFPRTVLTPEGAPIAKVRQWRSGFYFQDDWKATPNLTLNLGLRYDLFGLPKDKAGVARTLRFDLNPIFPPLFPAPGEVADLWLNEHRDLSPRFGFAYRLGGKMVVRGGYGIFYTAAHFDNVFVLQLNPPAAGSLTLTNPAQNPVATIQNPVPRQLVPGNPIFNVVTAPQDRKRRNAYIQNWNLQVSRQITPNDVLEVGYVASKGTFVDTSLNNFNSPPPGPGDIQARRPIQGYARIRMMAVDGNTIYHSLQTRYEHRVSKGLSLTTAYTWSHLIDDSGETINRGACQCQSARDRGRAERGNSLYDQRQRLVAGYVWELPWGKGLAAVPRLFLGGWSSGGMITLVKGSPFLITQSGDSLNNDSIGWTRPNLVSSERAELPNRDPFLWFNPAAFSRATVTHGTTPRNPLTGPGIGTLDLSVSKSFQMPFAESHELLFRAEFFNAFNTPQFANPGGTFGTGTFGRVTGVQIDSRQIQMALKYSF